MTTVTRARAYLRTGILSRGSRKALPNPGHTEIRCELIRRHATMADLTYGVNCELGTSWTVGMIKMTALGYRKNPKVQAAIAKLLGLRFDIAFPNGTNGTQTTNDGHGRTRT